MSNNPIFINSTDNYHANHEEVITIQKKKHKTEDELHILDERFKNVKFFADHKKKIESESYLKLLKYLSYEKVNAHQILFRQGDLGDKFYVILKGNVQVFVKKPDREVKRKSNKEKLKLIKYFKEFSSLSFSPPKNDQEGANALNMSVAHLMKSMAKFSQGFLKQTSMSELPESPYRKPQGLPPNKLQESPSFKFSELLPQKTLESEKLDLFKKEGESPQSKRQESINFIKVGLNVNPLMQSIVSEFNLESPWKPLRKKKNDGSPINILETFGQLFGKQEIGFETPRYKMSRPMIKLARFCSKFWHNSLRQDTKFRENINLPVNFFKKYDITFLQNKMLDQIRNKLSLDFLELLFPKWKRLLNLTAGFSFGEIALIQRSARQATIYCDEDTEFAVISKRNDQEFENIIKREKNAIESFLRSFDMFNYWNVRNKIAVISSYMIENENRIGNCIYKRGDNVNGIFFLIEGEIEIFIEKRHKNDMFTSFTDPKNFMVNENQNKFTKTYFKKIIKAPNPFGVEEFLGESRYRIFSAIVKSSACRYYQLAKDKIIVDLVSKNPQFLSYMLKYSCLNNKGLMIESNDKELLDAMRKKSQGISNKDAISLQKSMLLDNNKQKQVKGNTKSLLELHFYGSHDDSDKKDLNSENPEKILNKVDIDHANQLVKNMIEQRRKQKKFHFKDSYLGDFNKHSAYSKILQYEYKKNNLECDPENFRKNVKETKGFISAKGINEYMPMLDYHDLKLKNNKENKKTCLKQKLHKRSSSLPEDQAINYLKDTTNRNQDSLIDFKNKLKQYLKKLFAHKGVKFLKDQDEEYQTIIDDLCEDFLKTDQKKTPSFNNLIKQKIEEYAQKMHAQKEQGVSRINESLQQNVDKNMLNLNFNKSLDVNKNFRHQKPGFQSKTKDIFATNVRSKNLSITQNDNIESSMFSDASKKSNVFSRKERSKLPFEKNWRSDFKSQVETLMNLNMHSHFNMTFNTKFNQDNSLGLKLNLDRPAILPKTKTVRDVFNETAYTVPKCTQNYQFFKTKHRYKPSHQRNLSLPRFNDTTSPFEVFQEIINNNNSQTMDQSKHFESTINTNKTVNTCNSDKKLQFLRQKLSEKSESTKIEKSLSINYRSSIISNV